MTTIMKAKTAHEKTNADLAKVKSVADLLTEALTGTYRLVLKTHVYHWNVTGPLFHAVHVMTEEQYSDMFAAADDVAERVRALGKPAMVIPAQLSAGADGQDPDASLPATEMVKDLAADHENLARLMRALVKTAEDGGDPVTADLATARAAFHEKAAWMLHSLAA